MLVPLSRNPFPPGEKIVSRGKEYICQRCNAQEKSADVRGPKLESKFRNLTRLKCLTWGNLQYSPVHTTQNFVCFAKKSLNRQPFLVRMISFSHQKLHKHHQTSKLGDKIFCSLTAILYWVISFHEHYQWIIIPLIDIFGHTKNFMCVLSADKVSQKQKIGKYKIFKHFASTKLYFLS